MADGLRSVASLIALASIVGCAHTELDQPHNIRTVQIQESVEPALLYAQTGDEIRWENKTSKVVRVAFLGTPKLETVTCEKGFRWMWMMQDTATIQPHESVSLCFSEPGTIRFNIWMDWENDALKNISPTSKVLIEKKI